MLSSNGCLIIVRQLSDDNSTTVGRLILSKQKYRIKRHKDLLNEKENLNTLKTERFAEYNADKSLTLPTENRNSLWQKKTETS